LLRLRHPQRILEHAVRAQAPRAHAADRDAQRHRDLIDRSLVNVALEHHQAVALGQLLDGPAQQLGALRLFQLALGADAAATAVQPAAIPRQQVEGTRGALRGASLPPQGHEYGVGGNPVQPGAEVGVATEPPQVAQGRDHGVLRSIFGARTAAHHALRLPQ